MNNARTTVHGTGSISLKTVISILICTTVVIVLIVVMLQKCSSPTVDLTRNGDECCVKLPSFWDKLPDANKNNLWYGTPGGGRSAIVFVHGIFSDSRTCWAFMGDEKQPCNYWPQIVQEDEMFENVDIYLGGYWTELESGKYDVTDCAEYLFSNLNDDTAGRAPLKKYSNVLFVCHSTGGIVVKRMMTQFSNTFKDKNIGMLLIASPTFGSKYATYAEYVIKLAKNKLAEQLIWKNDSLYLLDEAFQAQRSPGQALANVRGLEFIETLSPIPTILPYPVVLEESAGRYWLNPIKIANVDHFSIVKPKDKDQDIHKALRRFWEDVFLVSGEFKSGPILPEHILPPGFRLVPKENGKFTDVTNTVTIAPGAQLIVERGITLRFTEGAGIRCEGSIEAIGTADDPITFTAMDENKGWGHVAMMSGGRKSDDQALSKFEYCTFEYGRGGPYNTPRPEEPESEFRFATGESLIGGAMLIYGTERVLLENCLFRQNSASAGGALYLRQGASIRLNNCEFVKNETMSTKSNAPGGAVYVRNSKPSFVQCHFDGNRAINNYSCGGALYFGFKGGGEVSECTFVKNEASYVGGAIYAYNEKETPTGSSTIPVNLSALYFRQCEFTDNSAVAGGGAAFLDEGYDAKFTDCELRGNRIGESTVQNPGKKKKLIGGAAIAANSAKEWNPVHLRIDENNDKLASGNMIVAGGAELTDELRSQPIVYIGSHTKYQGRAYAVPIAVEPVPAIDGSYNKRPPGSVIDMIVIHHISALNWQAEDFREDKGEELRLLDKKFGVETANIDDIKYDWRLSFAILELYKFSTHFMIDRDGRIMQFVSVGDAAHHAGWGISPEDGSKQNMNFRSIGIELISSHPKDDESVADGTTIAYTDSQYESLAHLLGYLTTRYSIKYLVGHEDFAGEEAVRRGYRKIAKTDPGPLFDWKRIRDDAGKFSALERTWQ